MLGKRIVLAAAALSAAAASFPAAAQDAVRIGLPLVLATRPLGMDAAGRRIVGYCFTPEPDGGRDG